MLILGTVQANVHQILPTQISLGNPGKKKKKEEKQNTRTIFPLTIKSFTLPEFFIAEMMAMFSSCSSIKIIPKHVFFA